jgi:hypothetical protein
LTGLPPTLEEIDQFEARIAELREPADSQAIPPTAIEELVDRLLASPAFGERWGRHWLDVARFAESSGGGRSLLLPNAWRYRDYVIRAFNEDKPFDRFIREQVAGDLLPHETDAERADGLTGTGFLVLGPTNYETQDKELMRMDVIDEQIDTIGRAFLGMTLGCARCHDHKFDPVPTKDYYALVGIFRSTKVLTPGNVSGWVERELPIDEEHRRALEEFAALTKPVEKEIADLREGLKKLDARLGTAAGAGSLDPNELPGVVVDAAKAKLVGSWKLSTHDKPYVGGGYLHDENSGKGQKSATFNAELPGAGLWEVRVSYTANNNRASNAPVTVRGPVPSASNVTLRLRATSSA